MKKNLEKSLIGLRLVSNDSSSATNRTLGHIPRVTLRIIWIARFWINSMLLSMCAVNSWCQVAQRIRELSGLVQCKNGEAAWFCGTPALLSSPSVAFPRLSMGCVSIITCSADRFPCFWHKSSRGRCRVLSLSDCRYSLNPLSQTRIDWVGRYRIRWTFKLSYVWH